jgi:DNA-binding CsgD family transcriptional regulator
MPFIPVRSAPMWFSRADLTRRLTIEIAELALGASGWQPFSEGLVALLAARIGVDESAYFLAPTTFGRIHVASSVGQAAFLVKAMPDYMAEVMPSEIAAAMLPRTQLGDDIIGVARRQRLRLYTEYLRSRQIASYAIRMWRDRDNVHWFVAGVDRASQGPRFEARTLAALDGVFPVVAVSMRLHRVETSETGLSRELTEAFDITPSEHRVLELLERGLTNPEIAVALGISANTVRNLLVSAFRKLDVSRRAEAVFVLRTAGSDMCSSAKQARNKAPCKKQHR